ncbi:hypothetical protein [uncultured Campylobacter sp.]|uniref:hypothetical protein n=1 Tax=uncultured Campylobacter sp. TaxID=218934 RepID=UPI002615D197|nr:hypothetical protein [uncultured Campylobacter sp.]
MKILAACKICSGVSTPVRSQPKMFAGALLPHRIKLRNAGLDSSASASHEAPSVDDDAETTAVLIYTSKSLNRCGILAHIILNFYDFGFHIRERM